MFSFGHVPMLQDEVFQRVAKEVEAQTGEGFFDTLVEELAKALGVSESNQRLLHWARTKIRQALAPYMNEIQPTPRAPNPFALKPCA